MFLSFFEGKGHLRLPSHSLVPENDNCLLIINSGMAPLKPYFTGRETPPRARVATCQKCVRTGDIDNVGKTARHGTFFEMLGNFSFGDYFKREIIPWSWEFVTEKLGIPTDRLYVTVYQDDDEAFGIWADDVGVPRDRIFRMGKDDNFWEVGLGPCGPCSEIYFDRGPEFGREGFMESVTADEDRYMEFWNLVFTQFNKEEDGGYTNLAKPNIDTGMGLERMAVITQGVRSIFDVDTVRAVRDAVCARAGIEYGSGGSADVSARVVTDHVRSVAFMTADGIIPSNEGRGYVLRRLLRRAARHGKLLGIEDAFIADVAKTAISVSDGAYPELREKSEYILKLITNEENRFRETIDAGTEILKSMIGALTESGGKSLPGADAFRLYDTFGFPLELTEEMLSEAGLTVDKDGFAAALGAQRDKARSAREESTYMGGRDTIYDRLPAGMTSRFVGYDALAAGGTILAITRGDGIACRAEAGNEVGVITDVTPIYAESGGQTGDGGVIRTETGAVAVSDCVKAAGKIVHIGRVTEGFIAAEQPARIEAEPGRRLAASRNHSATHLLQKALRETLGAHVEQAGSRVSADRLRFDFTHFAPMSADEIRRAEDVVNGAILAALPVTTEVTAPELARKSGATALFGEKYGDTVRVVRMGDFSAELCGGTHLTNTSLVGAFKIVSESGVAAGVRRVEAVTGTGALAWFRRLEDTLDAVSAVLKTSRDGAAKKAEQLSERVRELTREAEELRARLSGGQVDDIMSSRTDVGGVAVVSAKLAGTDAAALRVFGDKLRERLGSGVVVLAGEKDGKSSMIVMATDGAVSRGANAGAMIRAAAAAACGGGGGRPNMAQAGLGDASKTDDAIAAAIEVLRGACGAR
jgi:alanyl-tRNA synthetase